ncbi:MAG: NUDIX domain-containing protein [Methanomassiliicoccales archaeon]|jgi:8-oxo-dGTP diphosphatase
MRFVYAVAFVDDEFVMVRNEKRGGWEMPGGKVKASETDDEAISREFWEEVGHEFVPLSKEEVPGGAVYTGRMGEKIGEGEMDWRLFDSLPSALAFPGYEYAEVLCWARDKANKAKTVQNLSILI